MHIARHLNYDAPAPSAASLRGLRRDRSAMADTVHVRLNLSNSPENIPMVRQALAGFSEAIALSGVELNDIRTALTEACNNASLHAYAGEEGPMEVELCASSENVGVAVRDRGRGLTVEDRHVELPELVGDELPGIGLPAIHALADDVSLSARDGGGTEVAMSFATPQIRLAPQPTSLDGAEPVPLPAAWLASTVEFEMAPLALAQWVFPRVLRAMAARAYFTIDRLADAQRIGSVLVADAATMCSEHVHAGITATPNGVDFAIGPLADDSARALTDAVRAIEPGIERLADGHFLAGAELEVRLGLRLPRNR